VLSQPLWGLLADLRGRRATLLLALLLSAASIVGLAAGQTFLFLLLWTVAAALVLTPVSPLLDSLVLDHVDRTPGASFAQLRLWGAVGWGAVAYLVGLAITGRDMRLMFIIAAACMGLNWWLIRRVPEGERRLARPHWGNLGAVLRQRRLVMFLVLAMFAMAGTAPFYTFFPIYMEQIGASRATIGLALTVQGIGELPVYLGAATILRRLGPQRALAVATVVQAVRALLYGVLLHPLPVVALQLVHGAFSLFLVSSVEFVNSQVPVEWRATGQGLFQAMTFGAGMILGNVASGYLVDQIGIQPIYRLSSILILGSALAMLLLLRQPTPQAPT
jgi:MFS transporter, PPP family, 3-phenylpropionic acid transporter